MPTPELILAGLSQIAVEQVAVAILWHVLLAAALVACIAGWRPPGRAAAMLLIAPLLSVSAVAWLYRNPVNGVLFLLLAVALAAIGWRAGAGRVERGPGWSAVAGAAMIALGWAYPHFLDRGPLAYLYAAPLGLIPCPTLAAVIGLTLLGGGLGSRAFSYTLAGAGLVFGLFGLIALGVRLDLVLVAGACALGVRAARIGGRRSAPKSIEASGGFVGRQAHAGH